MSYDKEIKVLVTRAAIHMFMTHYNPYIKLIEILHFFTITGNKTFQKTKIIKKIFLKIRITRYSNN